MPLLLLRFSQIDLAAWDACVAASPNRGGLPYAFAWYLQITAGRWDAVVEPDGRGGYRSVLVLPVRRRPWGRQVVQPLFTQQLGLLLTAESQHRDLAEYLVLAVSYPRFYTQLGAAQPWPALPPALGFSLSERRTYHLSLAPLYPALLANYCADYRRRLRRLPGPLVGAPHDEFNSLNEPNPVRETAFAEAIISLFRQHKGAEIGSLKPRHYRLLARLIAGLQRHGHALLLELRAPETGELLSGAVFVRLPEVIIYLFSATSPAGRQAAGPLRLLDHVIQQHAGTPGLVLDFEGSMLPGVARFFANFGAAPVPYAALTSTRPPRLRLLKWMRP